MQPFARPDVPEKFPLIAQIANSVTVVSGLPRSGTSMMMQMLAAGGVEILTDQQRRADEDNPEGYFELEAVKRLPGDSAWLHDAPGKAIKVICRLLEHLPDRYEYKVLFMERPLEEVIASQRVMLERRGTQGSSVSTEKLRMLFAAELFRAQTWMSAQKNFSWIRVPYREMAAGSCAELERVCSFLGRPLDVAAMAARADRRLHRQRR
jgi:hypothetical protein